MRLASFRRRAVFAVAAMGLVASTGCIGSFQLTRKVYSWNKSVSSDKFVQEVVFLALNIVPVYSVATLADAVFANTVEFWTGENPVASARTLRPDGTALIQHAETTAEGKTLTIQEVKGGETLSTTIVTVPNTQETVTVTTTHKDGRVFTKTLARGADGAVTLQ
jgi:hypothetical protein